MESCVRQSVLEAPVIEGARNSYQNYDKYSLNTQKKRENTILHRVYSQMHYRAQR